MPVHDRDSLCNGGAIAAQGRLFAGRSFRFVHFADLLSFNLASERRYLRANHSVFGTVGCLQLQLAIKNKQGRDLDLRRRSILDQVSCIREAARCGIQVTFRVTRTSRRVIAPPPEVPAPILQRKAFAASKMKPERIVGCTQPSVSLRPGRTRPRLYYLQAPLSLMKSDWHFDVFSDSSPSCGYTARASSCIVPPSLIVAV